jgi:hypothetical protein
MCRGQPQGSPKQPGKTAYFRKKQTQTNLKICVKINPQAHGPPNSRHSHPRAELRFARGARCRTGKTPPRSRAGSPLGCGSASLEGRSLPRVRFRLARGPGTPSSEAPSRSRAERPLERVSVSLEDITGPPPPYLLPRQGDLMH